MKERHGMTGKTNHFYLVSGAHRTVVVMTCLFIQYEITNRKKRNILLPVKDPKKIFFL
jgi:hypothetical protein